MGSKKNKKKKKKKGRVGGGPGHISVWRLTVAHYYKKNIRKIRRQGGTPKKNPKNTPNRGCKKRLKKSCNCFMHTKKQRSKEGDSEASSH